MAIIFEVPLEEALKQILSGLIDCFNLKLGALGDRTFDETPVLNSGQPGNQATDYDRVDSNLVNLASTCRLLREVFNNPEFYSRLFKEIFDNSGESWESMMQKYQERRMIHHRSFRFFAGHTPDELRYLKLLAVLISEASPRPHAASQNIGAIWKFIANTNILSTYRNHSLVSASHGNLSLRPHPLLNVLQLVLAPYILGSTFVTPAMDYMGLHRAVYNGASNLPVIHISTGGRLLVNDAWLIEILNLFKLHMSRSTNSLVVRLEDWEDDGSFASEDDPMGAIAARSFPNRVRDSMFPELGQDFGELNFTFPKHSQVSWDATFETCLPSVPLGASNLRALRARSKRFDITGDDGFDDFDATGWLNPLPPQMSIPGWQRIVMVRYRFEQGSPEPIPIFQCEGIVLPGGQMMLGRASLPSEYLDPVVSASTVLTGRS
ncbi:MAG: hypothetical protein Q9165_007146 [Trypethelium subeluteriae]